MIYLFVTLSLLSLVFALLAFREIKKSKAKLKELEQIPKEIELAVSTLLTNLNKLQNTALSSSPKIMTSSLDPNDFKDQEEYMRALEEEIMSKLGDEGQAMEELEEMFKEDKKKGMLQ